MNDNEDFYKNFNLSSSKKSNLKNNVFVPFISGMLGTSLVIGLAFGVPNIRKTLKNNNVNDSYTVETSNSGTVDFISLNNYSDTATYAANKVLPSIVGITVEYTVTSNFIQNMSRSFFC